MSSNKPLLAITQGDPAGVGPEAIVGAWRGPAMHEHCHAVVVGHPKIFERAVELLKTGAKVVPVTSPDQLASSPEVIPCLRCGSDDAADVPAATVDPRGG